MGLMGVGIGMSVGAGCKAVGAGARVPGSPSCSAGELDGFDRWRTQGILGVLDIVVVVGEARKCEAWHGEASLEELGPGSSGGWYHELQATAQGFLNHPITPGSSITSR